MGTSHRDELFNRCIEIVLKSEGSYQCDPVDIGNYDSYGNLIGTNFGISARLFPDIDIKNLTREQAKDIYYQHYWLPMNLRGIDSDDLILHLFDHGINAGKRTAIRMIQRIVNVKTDGIIGINTVYRINSFGNVYRVIDGYGLLTTIAEHYIYARRCYYSDLVSRRPATQKYLKGWYNRIQNTHF